MSNTDKRRMEVQMKYNNYAADKLSKIDDRAVTTWTNNLPQFNTTDMRTVDRGLTPGVYAGGGKYYRTTTGGFTGERLNQDGFATLEAARAQQHLNMQIKMFGYSAGGDSSNSNMLPSTIA